MNPFPDQPERLLRQIEFIREIDKVKQVFRQSYLMDGTRRENDAEHSWHLAIMAIVLEEYAAETVDLSRVLRMVLIHDLVEIDAGDTFVYDETGQQDKRDREEKAAERIFGILPEEQRDNFREIWEEFEAKQTPEARYAASLDRLQPLLHNYFTEGRTWKAHGVKANQVFDRNRHIEEGAPSLWQFARAMIEDAVDKGYLLPPDSPGASQ
ncbi:MAG: HD domain-containing protein [Candidatus Sumerlaeia bacterium]